MVQEGFIGTGFKIGRWSWHPPPLGEILYFRKYSPNLVEIHYIILIFLCYRVQITTTPISNITQLKIPSDSFTLQYTNQVPMNILVPTPKVFPWLWSLQVARVWNIRLHSNLAVTQQLPFYRPTDTRGAIRIRAELTAREFFNRRDLKLFSYRNKNLNS